PRHPHSFPTRRSSDLAEALAFLEVAARAARDAGITPEPEFHFAIGVSCLRTGRFAEALQHLDRALHSEPDRLRRAGVLAQMASRSEEHTSELQSPYDL